MSVEQNNGDIRIRFYGPIGTYFSFAHANRCMMLALDRLGVDVTGNPRAIDPNLELPKRLHELLNKGDIITNSNVGISHDFPPIYNMEEELKILFLPWETNSVGEEYIINIKEKIDLVFTPSLFCRAAYINSGIEKQKEHTVYNGIDHNLLDKNNTPLDLSNYDEFSNIEFTDDMFVFLHCGHSQARKGSDLLLRA